MIASRRLINLAGTLLVAIALVAGTMLTALPIYLESRDLNDQERHVAASNQLLQTQIDALQAKEAELPQVEQDLADLHGQLPRIPKLDDVTQLVVKAAGKSDTAIKSIDFGDIVPFAVRDAEAVIAQLPQTATGVAPNANGDSSNANGDSSTEAGSAEGATTDSSAGDAGPTAKPAPPTPDQLQVPVTIGVNAADQASANRFLDELRIGQRLLRIDAVTATSDDDWPKLTLTITGFAFVSLS